MKQGLPEKPSAILNPETEPILSFEEFTHRTLSSDGAYWPRYYNFGAYFDTGEFGQYYRQTKHYKKFESKYPDMARLICEKIQNRDKADKIHRMRIESLEPFDKDLYEVYKPLRSCGASNKDLIGI